MNVGEKLVELLRNAKAAMKAENLSCDIARNMFVVDFLMANGVTVQEIDGCFRCKDSQEMTVTISNKLIDGVNTGWLGGNLPARYCPFCGRRLPQPPKGE